MAFVASGARGLEFFDYSTEQLMTHQQTSIISVPELPWIHVVSRFAQSGILQGGILAISVLCHLLRQHACRPAYCNSGPKASLIRWRYELLSQMMRAISVASLAFAYTTDGVHILDVIVLAYAFALGLLRLVNNLRWRRVALHQVNSIMTAMLLVLFLQLLPCIQVGTQCARSRSVIGGAAALSITVFVAFATPREPTPREFEFDNPDCLPNSPSAPEETCSWLSYFCTYDWLTPIIWKGTLKKLDISGIPGLVRSAEPLYLFRRLQESRARSATTLTTILRFQRRELTVMTFCIMACCAVENVAPYGMFKLLGHIDHPDKAVYHPWVWLCLVFFGPLFRSMLFQQYALTSRRLAISIKSAMIQELYHTALASIEPANDSFGLGEGGKQIQYHQVKAFRKTTSEGRLVNLMAADVDAIFKSRDVILVLAGVPVGTIIALIGIYRMLGWASLVGTGVLLLFIPISTWLGKILYKGQKGVRAAQDSRISLVAEYLASIRVIKYFAWESVVKDNILGARSVEQHELWRVAVFQVIVDLVSQSLPIVGLVAMFGIHAGFNKQPLDASTTFTTVFLVNNIRSNMTFVSAWLRNITRTMVSLERLDNYFKNTVPPARYPVGPLRMKNACFRRSKNNTSRLVNISIEFVEGGLNVVTGQSGSGKSSLLLAVLGETYWEGGDVTVPEDIAFVPQTPWLQNQTIQENILFGNHMEQVRYDRIIEACCLSTDITMLPGRDAAIVGENGELLSGGQRARVALARALYSKAPLLLLDDIFSALDAKTSEQLWRTCFCSDLLKGRTIVLVTQGPWISSQADLVVCLHQGHVQSAEHNIGVVRKPVTIADIISRDAHGTIETTAETETPNPPPLQSLESVLLQSKTDAMSVVNRSSSTTIVDQEMKASGKIHRWISLKYVGYWGNSWLVISCLVTLLLSNAFLIASSLWLSKWVEAYKDAPSVDIAFFLGVYAVICFLGLILSGLNAIQFEWGAWRAARKLHDDCIRAIMRVSMSWFVAIPTGRITNRLSGDIASIDGMLSAMLRATLTAAVTLCFRIGAVSSIIPQFMVPAIFACVFGVIVGEMFTRTAMVLRRLTSSAQSPVFSQFASTLAGLAVIRAGEGKPQAFKYELAAKIRVWSAVTDANYNSGRWLSIRVDFISALVALSAGIIALSSEGMISAALVGFSLTNANSLSLNVMVLVRTMNDLEVELQSFHRLKEYTKLSPEEEEDDSHDIEDENVPHDDVHHVPDIWPASGNIEFRNATIRYDLDGPDILTDVNLKLESGDRVAIVGRTGSGKSTILASLLRFTHIVSGQVLYDGVDITKVPRRRLRESLAIIPQEALLFNGTIRSNLDPSGCIPVPKLESVLESCASIGLLSGGRDSQSQSRNHGEEVSYTPPSRDIKLGTVVEARGTNFSHGQRQVLSFCRALARENKVMLLDEATASMDYETDRAIQQILRQKADFMGETQTVVTVAHRLQTIIDYDKVVVMSMGRVVEFDTPKELYRAKGLFHSMVLHSGESAALQESLAK